MQLIAISQRTESDNQYHETRDSLDQRWYNFFSACGITPLIVPNDTIFAKILINTMPINGIILTGGNYSPSRDKTEIELIQFAITNKLPILGICHGMQMIQQYFTVSLHPVSGHISSHQEIFIHNKRCEVNSYHELGTTESSNELIVWARGHDNIVKAICHVDKPIVGIMWHPERYDIIKKDDIELTSHLFNIKKQHPLLSILRHETQHQIA